jgi:hypothetical protein
MRLFSTHPANKPVQVAAVTSCLLCKATAAIVSSALSAVAPAAANARAAAFAASFSCAALTGTFVPAVRLT